MYAHSLIRVKESNSIHSAHSSLYPDLDQHTLTQQRPKGGWEDEGMIGGVCRNWLAVIDIEAFDWLFALRIDQS